MEFGENGFEGAVHNPPDGDPHPFELCEEHGHMDPRRPDAPPGPLHEALYSKSNDGQVTMLLGLPDTALGRLEGPGGPRGVPGEPAFTTGPGAGQGG